MSKKIKEGTVSGTQQSWVVGLFLFRWLICFILLLPSLVFAETDEFSTNISEKIIDAKEKTQGKIKESNIGLYQIDENYVFGPGDEIAVYLKGDINTNYNIIINPEGKIFIPKVGEIIISGLSIKESKREINSELSKYYKNFELVVHLVNRNTTRAFSKSEDVVTIKGEVFFPGIYELKKNEKISQIIYKAGGFKSTADLKKAFIDRKSDKSDSREVIPVDLNEVLVQKNFSQDKELKNGDNIFIPSIPHLVNVAGSVNKPGAYEYSAAAPVSYYIGLAGGFTEEASRNMNITKLDGKEVDSENYIPEPGDTIYSHKKFFSFVNWRDYMQIIIDVLAIYAVYSLIIKK